MRNQKIKGGKLKPCKNTQDEENIGKMKIGKRGTSYGHKGWSILHLGLRE